MSLIENLADSNRGWKNFLEQIFAYSLGILKTNRFQVTSSSVDDLTSWLTAGGISRVRYHLQQQMQQCRFSENHQADILQTLDELVQRHRLELLDLMAVNILPLTQADLLLVCGWSAQDFEQMCDRTSHGENPIQDWLRSQGNSEQSFVEAMQKIETWLFQNLSQIHIEEHDLN